MEFYLERYFSLTSKSFPEYPWPYPRHWDGLGGGEEKGEEFENDHNKQLILVFWWNFDEYNKFMVKTNSSGKNKIASNMVQMFLFYLPQVSIIVF